MLHRHLIAFVLLALLVSWVYPSSHALADNPAPQVNTGRWQIYRADLAPGSEIQGGTQRGAVNSTILLDSVTGDTFLLWPTDIGGKRFYAWVPLDKQKTSSPNSQPGLGAPGLK
jgi:hypothetical protein